MKRRSFHLRTADGSIALEIERGQNAALEVNELDSNGNKLNGVIVHTWEDARDRVADIFATAIREGRV